MFDHRGVEVGVAAGLVFAVLVVLVSVQTLSSQAVVRCRAD